MKHVNAQPLLASLSAGKPARVFSLLALRPILPVKCEANSCGLRQSSRRKVMVPDQNFYEDGSKSSMPALPRSAPTTWVYDVANPCADESGATCKNMGADMVDGRSCDNWQFDQADKSWTACVDKNTGIVLRRTQSGTTFELTNVKVHKLDPKLFELMPGLKKGGFTMPMHFGAGGPGGPGGPGGFPGGPPGAPPGAAPAAAPLRAGDKLVPRPDDLRGRTN